MSIKLAFSVSEAVEISGISRSFLYKCIAQGKGPKFRKAGSRTLILRSDLEAWLKNLPLNSRDSIAGPETDSGHKQSIRLTASGDEV